MNEYLELCLKNHSIEFFRICAENCRPDILRLILTFAILVAEADGEISRLELALLRKLGESMGFDPDEMFGDPNSSDRRGGSEEMVTWCQVFCVEENATLEQVKLAYYKYARQFHPDLWRNAPESEQQIAIARMKAVNAAYSAACDHFERQAETTAKRAAEEFTRNAAKEHARRETEEHARKQAEAKAKREAEDLARRQATASDRRKAVADEQPTALAKAVTQGSGGPVLAMAIVGVILLILGTVMVLNDGSRPELEWGNPTELLVVTTDDVPEFRVWSDRHGKYQRDARFLACSRSMVVLEYRDGTRHRIKRDLLSVADASWLVHIEYRQWTDTTGKFTLVARLLNAADGTIRLETKNGNPKKIRLDRLSNADKEYVQLVILDSSEARGDTRKHLANRDHVECSL